MKLFILLCPFPTLAVGAVLLALTPAAWTAILFLIAWLGCLAAVPLLSRIKLIYGYMGLLFSLLLLVGLLLNPKRMETNVTVVNEGTLTMPDGEPLTTDEFLGRMDAEIKKRN